MALPDSPRRLTYDDYLLFPEDGQRHEVLDGEHYVTPSPFITPSQLLPTLPPGRTSREETT